MFSRFFNPFDRMLRKMKGNRVLLFWNRGLGDIPLGIYAVCLRIRELVSNAEITVMTRPGLASGFTMLEGVKIIEENWVRGEKSETARDLTQYDLVIKAPDPTRWVKWQLGKVQPKLKWNIEHDILYTKFHLGSQKYVGVQIETAKGFGPHRNWKRWSELFSASKETFLLFGQDASEPFPHPNVIDLRGKTTLFELLSIIKHKCKMLITPDTGILAMVYYLDEAFPIRIISLWADPRQGVLKQNVASPNPLLEHIPLIAKNGDLATLAPSEVLAHFLNVKPLYICHKSKEASDLRAKNGGGILLAGGMGTRLGTAKPKGCFELNGKSLFQRLCEKASPGPIAVMTSVQNHEATVAFFKEHGHFGREVYFFTQEDAPMRDDEGKPVLMGPNGNGNVFAAFKKAGLQEVFRARGVDFVVVSNVDNVLINLVDPSMRGADMVVQCIPWVKGEKMGAITERGIVEYTELDPLQEYKYAYSGQLGFSLSFFSAMAEKRLPLHWVKKQGLWKGEQFHFEAWNYTKNVRIIEVDRKTHFAPLKEMQDVSEVLCKLDI